MVNRTRRSGHRGVCVMRVLMRSSGVVPGIILFSLCSIGLAHFTASLSAQTLKLEVVGTISGPADVVRVNGTYAYVAAGPTLSVIDVRDPSSPKLMGAVTLPDTIVAVTVSGSVAYVANALRGLAVVDVSNPAAPALRGSLKTPGEALRVALAGTKAIVANRLSGLEVIDVSNMAKPVSLGSFYTDGYARDVATSGSVAYVVDSSQEFSVVDVSKPGPPTGVSTQREDQPTEIIAVAQPGAAAAPGAKTAYVLGGGMLQVYDVSNPSALAKVTTFKLPGRAQGLTIQGSLAYVAAGPEGVQIIDLSDPAKPAIAGSYKTAGPARDVAVRDSLVFVAVGEVRRAGAGSNGAVTSPAVVLILRQSS